MGQVTNRLDICAGKPYTTAQGEQKKQWIKIGERTIWDDGSSCDVYFAMPVGNWWDGKISAFQRQQPQPQQAQMQQIPSQMPQMQQRPQMRGAYGNYPQYMQQPTQQKNNDDLPY